MPEAIVDETARVIESDIKNAKVFKDAWVIKSIFGNNCSIGDNTNVERCQFENNVVINRRSYINDSFVGKFTYMGINTTMNYTKIGAFCSIARNVDIGGFNHDYRKLTTMPAFRFNQTKSGGGKLENNSRYHDYCIIGNDVWIAAGAQVLHNVTIGDGAVIGANAVVTKDIPPYAIAVGVPARVIGYRCDEKLIDSLLEVKWWDWPNEVLIENMDYIINNDITEETVNKLKKISESYYNNLEVKND